jgi:hypothetical protein
MTPKTHIAVAVAAACLAASPGFAEQDKDDKREGRWHEQRHERHDRDDHGKRHEKDRDDRAERREKDDWRDKDRFHRPRTQVKVPPGHLPPPGECRIWFPDRPPGHQPPPGDCRELSRRVPHGAVLIEGG